MKRARESGVGQSTTPLTNLNTDPIADSNLSVDSTQKTKPDIKSKADSALIIADIEWQDVPADIVIRIFDSLAQQVFSSGQQGKASALNTLIQFGSVNKIQHYYLKEFLKNHDNGPQLKAEILAFRQISWKKHASDIAKNYEKLRDDFSKSTPIICAWAISFGSSNSSSAVHQEKSLLNLEEFDGICIDLGEFQWKPEMKSSLASLNEKVIKLDGKKIGKERLSNELIPLLKCLNTSCSIVLDISGNQLKGEDLNLLLEYMEMNSNIYRLDLSENPLFEEQKCCSELLKLFGNAGPLTHFYLSNTGFNDLTAAGLQKAIAAGSVLVELDLSDNQLTEEGAIAVMKAIVPGRESEQRVITSIRSVKLFNNNLIFSERLEQEMYQVVSDIEFLTEDDPELGIDKGHHSGWPIRKFNYSNVFIIKNYSKPIDHVEGGILVGGRDESNAGVKL